MFLEKICKEINLPKPEVYQLVMVTNYILYHNVPSKEEQIDFFH